MKVKSIIALVVLMAVSAHAREYLLKKDITVEFKSVYKVNETISKIVVVEEDLSSGFWGTLSGFVTQMYTGYAMTADAQLECGEVAQIKCTGEVRSFTETDDYYVNLKECYSSDLDLQKEDKDKKFFVDYK